MKKITTNQIMLWKPCPDYTRARVAELIGKGKTPLQILDLNIPAVDRLWVVLREEIIPRREMGLLACDYATAALPIWQAQYPNDERPADCLAVARRYWRGEATEQERTAARDAAWDAAGAAAWDAGDAAWDAAGAAQIEMTRAALARLSNAEGK